MHKNYAFVNYCLFLTPAYVLFIIYYLISKKTDLSLKSKYQRKGNFDTGNTIVFH